MERSASAEWQGTLKAGSGKISTKSGLLENAPYSFTTRFGEEKGTNPEELIASAHAACFTMALSAEIEKLGVKPEMLHTDAKVSFGQVEGKWSVTGIHLDTSGKIAGGTASQFEGAANTAKENCPISRLLNAKITLSTKFLGSNAV